MLLFPRPPRWFDRVKPLRGVTLLLALFCALSCSGCSRFARTRQCRKLIAEVNPALDEVTALTHEGSTSSGYVSAAARYERLAKDLGPMEFSSEQMAKSVAEYASILSGTAQSLRVLSAALTANNNAEAEKAEREIDRLNIRERGAVARIDAWCRSEQP